MLFSAILT